MNLRTSLIGFLTLLCVATLCAVFAQRSQLKDLRADPQRLLADQSAAGELTPPPSASLPEPSLATEPVPRELLRLRNDVARLRARRRELAGVSNENEQLRLQVMTSSNSASGVAVPSGYIRKSQARMAGYATPEATVESFLWAIKSHDPQNLKQAITPESRRALQQQTSSENGLAEFFKAMDALPGIQVMSHQALSDNTAELQLQMGRGGDFLVDVPRVAFLIDGRRQCLLAGG